MSLVLRNDNPFRHLILWHKVVTPRNYEQMSEQIKLIEYK